MHQATAGGSPPAPRAAYIHVPFCAHRCGYCNFSLVAGRSDLVGAYLEALARELSWMGEPKPVDTLFIGGGTPTWLPPAALERLLQTALDWFPPAPHAEFTVEANPADFDARRVAILAAHGVNRISLGAQSFDVRKLRVLERDHRPFDICRSVELARRRLRSVSLDLIFAVPGETLATWRRDLAAALKLQPDHISTYGLTFERGTLFWNRLLHGRLERLDEELERRQFAEAIDTVSQAGYEHYEVSSFARLGHRCRHNEVYWAAGEYFAAGPGAARYVGGRREVNHRSTTTWLGRVLAGRSPVAETETLSAEERAREALVLGLRRLDGVEREAFAGRTGFDLDALAGEALARYVQWGLLDDNGSTVRLTREGLFVSDSMWPAILAPRAAATQ